MRTTAALIEKARATRMTVAIVNYNTRDVLRNCLLSLHSEPQAEIIVVDNGSTDGSAAMVATDFPHVRLEVVSNEGYGAAANVALKRCAAPYLLLLNSDVVVPAGTVKELCDHLDAHPDVAVVGPRLHNADGSLQESCYPFLTPVHWFLTATNLARFLGRLPWLRYRTVHGWPHDHPRSVHWVKGAALGLRRDAVLAIGGFDPRFFMYWEEVDLCYRLRRCGWRTDFLSHADVVHEEAASTRQRRAEMAVRQFRSALLFYRIHYSRFSRLRLRGVAAAVMFWRIGRDTLRIRRAKSHAESRHLSENVRIWREILRHCAAGR